MSTPPPTPPTKSKWGRMGGIIRRASQVSLKRTRSREVIPSTVPALSPPSQPIETSLPSPIAESPAREAEALRQDIVGPSPLAQPSAQEIRPASPESIAMEPAAAPNGGEDEQATSPTGYTPPPGIDSSAGNPGTFMDNPEALPQPVVVVDPYAAAPAPAETATDVPPPVIDSSAGNPGAFTDDLDHLPQPTVIADPFTSTPNPVSYLAPVPAETEFKPKPVEIPALESSTSNFDKRMTESMKDFEFVDHEEAYGDTPTEFDEAVVDNAEVDTPAFAHVAEVAPEVASESAPAPAPAPQEAVDLEHGEAAPYYGGDPPMPIAGSVRAPTQPTAAPAPAPTQEPTAAQPTFGAAVMPQYDEHLLYSGGDIWGGAIHTSTSQQKAHKKGRHDVWTIAAAADAVASAAVVGGMAHTGRSGQQEEEHRAYTSTSLGRSSSHNRTPKPNPHPESKTNNEIHANPSAPIVPSR
jgi:hypothetical protein